MSILTRCSLFISFPEINPHSCCNKREKCSLTLVYKYNATAQDLSQDCLQYPFVRLGINTHLTVNTRSHCLQMPPFILALPYPRQSRPSVCRRYETKNGLITLPDDLFYLIVG